MVSLEEGPVGSMPSPDETGAEFNAYTLTGEYGALFAALLRWVEEGPSPKAPLDHPELIARLRAHIHRGVGTLSVRAKSSLDILRPTVRKPGSEIWFAWNPRNKDDPVDLMFRGEAGPPRRSIIVNVNWDNNPFLSQEARDEMEYDRRRDPDKYRHIWLGDYQAHSEARVFRNWRVGTREEFDQFLPPGSEPRDGRKVRSTSETFLVGTRIATPSSLPFSSGSTSPTALAAPVEVGIIDSVAERAR